MGRNKKTSYGLEHIDELLVKLGQSKTELLAKASKREKIWCLYIQQTNGRLKDEAIISDTLVNTLLGLGNVEIIDGRVKLTRAGRVALKRKMTNSGDCLGQHQIRKLEQVEIGGTNRLATVNLSESPLAWLFTRKGKNGLPYIEEYQFASGEKLRTDYEMGAMHPKQTFNWDAFGNPRQKANKDTFQGLTISERAMSARKRVHEAIQAVGPELSGILIDVCCYFKGLEETEKQNGWPKRSGKIILRMALTRLARHYGFLGEEKNTANHSKKISHWGEADYRPSIDNWITDADDR